MQINYDEKLTITERILKVIDYMGITRYKFCKDLGLSNAFLDKPREISTDKYANILEYAPDISPNWLLTGKGPMLKSDLPIARHADPEKSEGIPLIPIQAFAGIATGEVSILEYECERYIIPLFKDAEFLIPVKGSSMVPKYNAGDIIACKKLSLSDIFFQWNKVYVIDTDQGVLVKRIHRAKDSDHIKIISENPAYEPFELHLSKIHAIAIVIGVVRLE